ncbi:MAG: helix-turn-helix domain-containing protein, partial [Deltaproteobacteria bacterium]|nr:helix-turn-helix domain-containing protein [Deltaproteobacteria bacterium]
GPPDREHVEGPPLEERERETREEMSVESLIPDPFGENHERLEPVEPPETPHEGIVGRDALEEEESESHASRDEILEAEDWFKDPERIEARGEELERLVPDVEFPEREDEKTFEFGEPPDGEAGRAGERERLIEGPDGEGVESLVPDVDFLEAFESQPGEPEKNPGGEEERLEPLEEREHDADEGREGEEAGRGGGEWVVERTDEGVRYRRSWVEDRGSLRTEARFEVCYYSGETPNGVVHSSDVARWEVTGERRDLDDRISRVVSLSREESYSESQYPEGREPVVFVEPKEEEALERAEKTIETSDPRLRNVDRVEVERRIWVSSDGRSYLCEERRTLHGRESGESGVVSFTYQCTDRAVFGEADLAGEGQPEKTGTSGEGEGDGTRGVGEYRQSVEAEHRGADGTVQSTLFRDDAELGGDKRLILWEKETIHVKYVPQQSAAQAENRSEQAAHGEREETTVQKEPSEEAHPQAADHPQGRGKTSAEAGGGEKPPQDAKENRGPEASFETSDIESANSRREVGEVGGERPGEAGGEGRTPGKEGGEAGGRGEAKENTRRESGMTGERGGVGGERRDGGESSEGRLVAGVRVPRVVLSADVDDVMRRAVLKAGGREALINKLRRLGLRFDEKQIRGYEYSKSREMDGHTFVALLKFLKGHGRVGEVLRRLNERVTAAKRLVKGDWGDAGEFIYLLGTDGKRYIFSFAEVLKLLSEGVRKAGSLEKLAEELRKRGRGTMVYGYLINEWLRSREVPLEVFMDAVRYVEETEEKARERINAIVEKTGSKVLSHNFQELVALDPYRLAADPLTVQKLEERARRLYESDSELRRLVGFEDLVYVMSMVVGGLLRGLPQPRNRKEAEKIEKVVEEAFEYFQKLLGRVKRDLLNLRVEKLTEDEVEYVRNVAQVWEKERLSVILRGDASTSSREFLSLLAEEIGVKRDTLRSYVALKYDQRNRMTRKVYFKICDVLGLPEEMSESRRVSRKKFLLSFLNIAGELEDESITGRGAGSEIAGEEEKEEELLLPWFEQRPGICCVFFEEDLQRLWGIALRRWGGVSKVTRRIREFGIKLVTKDRMAGFAKYSLLDVELVLALIGAIINRRPDEVRVLARKGELAKVFKKSLENQKLVDEQDSEWLNRLPRAVVREVSLKALAKEKLGGIIRGGETVTPKTARNLLKYLEQRVIKDKFRFNLPREVRSELRKAIKKMRDLEEQIITPEELQKLRKEKGLTLEELAKKAGVHKNTLCEFEKGLRKPKQSMLAKIFNTLKEENGEKIELKRENLYNYAARKIKEKTGKQISSALIQKALSGDHRIRLEYYFTMCEVFGVEPRLSLHYRKDRRRERLRRIHALRTSPPRKEIDFPIPVVYRHPNGKTVQILETPEKAYVIIDDRRLEANKKKKRYGGKWWGLTIIDYETDEGVYTVVKELGELWPPLVTPWYITPLNWDIRFKTTQTLKELFSEIRENLPESVTRRELAEIIRMGTRNVKGKKRESTLRLNNLMTLIALKSVLTQTDAKSEIRKIEKQIAIIEVRKHLKTERKEKTLYINLKSRHGAELIGHTLGDANLHRDKNRIYIKYENTEYNNLEAVSECLQHFGAKGKIGEVKEKQKTRNGTKRKKKYYVFAGGFIGYALYRAVPLALGKKTQRNPKAPLEIIENRELAGHLIQAMIRDETNISAKDKSMKIEMHVDVTQVLKKRDRQKIRAIAEKQVKQKENEKGAKLTHLEELAARHVKASDVSEEAVERAKTVPCNPLLSLKKALETFGLETGEEDLDHFYPSPSKEGNITASWKIRVKGDETKKAYVLNLLAGPKKATYELSYKQMTNRVRLTDPKNGVWKLTKVQEEKLRKTYEKYCQEKKKKVKYLPFSIIESKQEFADIVEIIRKNPSKKLEKKWSELAKKGIRTKPPEPVQIYFGKEKNGVTSVKWQLEWFEKPEEVLRNGRG